MIAQTSQTLRVDLTDAALGHTEETADLGEREPLVVIEDEHGPDPIGHPAKVELGIGGAGVKRGEAL